MAARRCSGCWLREAGVSRDGTDYDPGEAGDLITPFGSFHVPNISPYPPAGIGDWSDIDFVNAMARGVLPNGAQYYPAFPYTSCKDMAFTDLLDLKAFIDILPAVDSRTPKHKLQFPFSFRRGIRGVHLLMESILYLDWRAIRRRNR